MILVLDTLPYFCFCFCFCFWSHFAIVRTGRHDRKIYTYTQIQSCWKFKFNFNYLFDSQLLADNLTKCFLEKHEYCNCNWNSHKTPKRWKFEMINGFTHANSKGYGEGLDGINPLSQKKNSKKLRTLEIHFQLQIFFGPTTLNF